MPPLATSKSPLRCVSAPVNAPLRWPNSSLSTRFSGRAPQFTGMNVWPARWLLSWRFLAISSLPVPVSPRIITLASVGAIVSIRRRTACIAGVSPIRVGVPSAALSRVSSAVALFGQVAALGHPAEDDLQLGPLARLGQVVERPEPQRLHGGVDRGVAGEDDHLRVGADLADLAQDLDPGQAGHPQVQQGGVVRPLLQRLQGRRAVGADGDLVAEPGQLHLHQVAEVRLVVGEQDPQAALVGFLHENLVSSVRLSFADRGDAVSGNG